MVYIINPLDILVLDGTLLDTNYINRIILLTNTNKNRADELIKFL